MSGYVVIPLTVDPVTAEEKGHEVMRAQFPSWEAADADPITILLRATSVMDADLMEVATRVSEETFRYAGRGLYEIPPVDDTPAIGQILVTAQDTSGPYIVEEGLEVVAMGPSGEQVAFRTIAEGTIANGETEITLDVEAAVDGTVGNGISGTAEFGEYIDYLTAVEFVGTTSGGIDAETDEEFLDRLREELKLQSPRPILPDDFAVLARRFAGPGYRATAIDGLDPTDDSLDNERMVAVAVRDEFGEPASAPVKATVDAGLEALREQNFVIWVIDPDDATTVNVTFSATALPGWATADVEEATEAAVASHLAKATWGQRDDTGDALEWINKPTVYWGEVYAAIQAVVGVQAVTALSLNAGAAGANVALSGNAPVPTTGTIVGTIV